MKKSFYLMAALLVAMVGCNKEPQQGGPDFQDGKLYMQFSVNMLTTRTGTDESGDTNSDADEDFEVGKDRENKISKVDIILTNNEGAYVVADNVVPAAASTDTYVASFSTLELTGGATYDVYIYANCDAPAAKDIDAISAETVANITKDNNFWMTNAYAAVPTTLPTDLSLHTQPNNPLNLGSHYVERVMARFDFMPKNDNKFNILKGEEVNATITLTEAALINQSKKFYMFRRVGPENATADNWEIGGVETPMNYVVDTDFAAKANGYADGLAENFDYHMTDAADWDWKSITAEDLIKEDLKDNWTGIDDGKTDYDGTHDLNDYYIWQYAKENTIPNVKAQDHGISTGVVFKGEITGSAIPTAAGTDGTWPVVYVFENVLYGTWNDVVVAAKADNAPATLLAAVNTVATKDDNGNYTLKENADFAAAGFTGYKAEGGKYYAYYYYWNRHNDNGNNINMGPMEFAVVRNNVYKLCVDKIAKFGHPNPNDPDKIDPDPVDPDDPDEELNYYFTVTVKVLPWVVRVNHIEF